MLRNENTGHFEGHPCYETHGAPVKHVVLVCTGSLVAAGIGLF